MTISVVSRSSMNRRIWLTKSAFRIGDRDALAAHAASVIESQLDGFEVAVAETLVVLSEGHRSPDAGKLQRLQRLEIVLRPERHRDLLVYGLNLAGQVPHLLSKVDEAESKAVAAFWYLSRANAASPGDLLHVLADLCRCTLARPYVDERRVEWLEKFGQPLFERCKDQSESAARAQAWDRLRDELWDRVNDRRIDAINRRLPIGAQQSR